MTYSPTMKFHNFINTPKILLLLAIILSGCASLSIYDKTYNLEGKISYVSSENSFIARAKIKIENESIYIELADNFLEQSFIDVRSKIGDQWELVSYRELVGSSEQFNLNMLPSPEVIIRLIKKECGNRNVCSINQTISNSNYEVKFILNAI